MYAVVSQCLFAVTHHHAAIIKTAEQNSFSPECSGVAIDSILITQRPTVNTLIIGAVIRGLSHCFVAVAASSIAEVSTPVCMITGCTIGSLRVEWVEGGGLLKGVGAMKA